jgi:hypothetical protein
MSYLCPLTLLVLYEAVERIQRDAAHLGDQVPIRPPGRQRPLQRWKPLVPRMRRVSLEPLHQAVNAELRGTSDEQVQLLGQDRKCDAFLFPAFALPREHRFQLSISRRRLRAARRSSPRLRAGASAGISVDTPHG